MDYIVKTKKIRPVNLDLQTIRFPVTAIASITHRVSGVIMFIAVGILLWMLDYSLSSPDGFNVMSSYMDGFFVKFILWGILTALSYHAVAGIRHLLMDLGFFETLDSGKLSAKAAFIITAVLSVFAGALVW